MKEKMRKYLFSFFMLVAVMATSRYTWFGTYEPETPKSLKNKN